MSRRSRQNPSSGSSADNEVEELTREVHRFSMEAFAVAKSLVSGEHPPEAAKAQAAELQARLPEIVTLAGEAPEDRRPDLNRTLSDARLDLTYVMSDGTRPSSVRLARFREDLASGQ